MTIMKRYKPLLANGKVVKLGWPIAMYRYVNNICWPLEDDVSRLARIIDRIGWVLGFFWFMQHNEAEVRYIRMERKNLEKMLTGVPTYLVLVEIHLRAFTLALHKERFKEFMKKFYTQLYVDESMNKQHYDSIRRQLRPTLAFSGLYLLCLLTFFLVPVMNIINNTNDLIYKMVYPFDHTHWYTYWPVVFTNFYIGLIVATMAFGEANLISEILLHVNARFILMRDELLQNVNYILKHTDATMVAHDYMRVLSRIVKRNADINLFLEEVHNEFSPRIFVSFAFSTTILCTVGFIVYLNPIANIGYVAWAIAKIIEMLALGEISSTLLETTDNLHSVYYESNWEAVIAKSSNTEANVRLMKMVVLAIELNSKPFYLRGLDFFSVSLRSVVTILQGAGSYFTVLISFR